MLLKKHTHTTHAHTHHTHHTHTHHTHTHTYVCVCVCVCVFECVSICIERERNFIMYIIGNGRYLALRRGKEQEVRREFRNLELQELVFFTA